MFKTIFSYFKKNKRLFYNRLYKRRKERMCRPSTQVGDTKNHYSPSKKYRLVISSHATGERSWNYTKAQVFKDTSDKPITVVCRNYSHFPYLFVENHPNGHDYLICGEDYQGQTIIELDTGKRVDYLPSTAEKGFGFCWAEYYISPGKKTLAVEGCFWGAPYEVWLVDFSDPMKMPLPVLHKDRAHDTFAGWTGPESCKIGETYDVYVPLNKKECELTGEDWDFILSNDDNDDHWQTVVRPLFEWSRDDIK